MNLASLTKKDVFQMKLKGIPFEIRHLEDGDRWVSKEDLALLKKYGAIEDGLIKHPIRVWSIREIGPRQYRAMLDETLEVGMRLGNDS